MMIRGVLLVVGLASMAWGVTPMDAPLPEGQITEIEVAYPGGAVGRGAARLEVPARTFHYKVYVPKGYAADPKLRYPAVFIAAAQGNATLGEMKRRIEANGWIAVMLVEAQRGAWEPTVGNFLAAHDDAVKRLRIADGFKVATGQADGGRAASRFVGLRPGFGALVLQSAGWWSVEPGGEYETTDVRGNGRLAVWMTIGDSGDLRKGEREKMERTMRGVPFVVEEFAGGNRWTPRETIEGVFDQVERHLYVDGAKTGEAGIYPAFFHRLAARAATLGDEPLAERETLELAIDLARKRGLMTDAGVAERVAKMRARQAELEKDERVKDALAAKAAFRKLRAAEAAVREKFDGRLERAQPTLTELAEGYASIAAKFSGTSYGEQAASRADTLRNEAELLRKGANAKEPRKPG